jgi:hypothetical protein
MGRPNILCFALLLIIACILPKAVFALPIHDQTGNLIENGNFESGSYSPWWLANDSPTVSVVSDCLIDGDFAALIDTTLGGTGDIGNWVVGLYQYPGVDPDTSTALPDATYTASAWFYPIQGQAHLGLAWNGGLEGAFSSPTTTLDEWQFLEVTHFKPGLGGPLLYGLSNQDIFYVDGVWVNEGENNLSPYSPQNGFPGNLPDPIPEPTTILLLSTGIAGIAGFRKRLRKR